MTIRTYRSGDEVAQAAIFNAACGSLPGFKLATAEDLRRRFLARHFDPTTRFYAEEKGQVVGYCAFHPNGRVSYPWCLPGHERHAEPLFTAVLEALTARGIPRALAAYHQDWTAPAEFFPAHGLPKVRDMVNFVQELTEMPTLLTRSGPPITPFRSDDLPTLHAMAPDLWRGLTVDDLHKHLLANPFFTADALFTVRSRMDQKPLAVGILIEDPTFADPLQLDASQPCFRLGAFGTEGMQHKRVNGMFSFVVPEAARSAPAFAMDLMSHAAALLDGSTAHAVAAQVPSDQPHLLRFYQSHFRQQGSFPVYERRLAG